MANVLVVGAGISGCVAARLLAERGYEVLLVDRRNHVGGNAYDARNAAGITIQMHGAHVFHANDNKVWDFLSRFCDWRPCQLRVQAHVAGRLVPFPINIDTINELYGFRHDADSIAAFYDSRRQRLESPKSMRDAVISRIGPELYELFFENYSRKMWGVDASSLPVFMAGRRSARDNRDDRYFTDCYQGIPEQGFTAMFTAMINHPNIETRLNCPYRDLPDDHKRLPTVYTGCIDEYFGHRFGKLPYRSIRFFFKTYDYEWHQPAAVVHYPNDYDFTRITEFKHLYGNTSRKQTTVVYEYPCDEGDPYLPLPTLAAREAYRKYAEVAEELEGMYFTGPLGRYRSMDMNHSALAAMELVEMHFPPAVEECSVIMAEGVAVE